MAALRVDQKNPDGIGQQLFLYLEGQRLLEKLEKKKYLCKIRITPNQS